MAIFKKTCLPTSRKYVSKTGIRIPDSAENLGCQIFQRNFSFFGRTPLFLLSRSNIKTEIFGAFLTPRHPLVDTFQETFAPASREYVAEPGIIMPNVSEKFLW